VARERGLVDEQRWSAFAAKRAAVAEEQKRLHNLTIKPADFGADAGAAILGVPLKQATPALDLLRRPGVGYTDLQAVLQTPQLAADAMLAGQIAEQVQVQAKYSGYIEHQRAEIERQRIHEETVLPAALDYAAVSGLSNEIRAKLAAARPATLGQASRLPGMTPAAVSLLLVHLKKHGYPLRKAG